MQDKIKRVKDMYNACAKNFSQYLTDHNMDEYNNRSMKIKSEYGNRADIVDLLFWFGRRKKVRIRRNDRKSED